MNQQIVINNQLISFVKQGSELAEQTLLFLHGWRSNKEAWNGVVSKLISGSANKLVYAIDLPGFGSSPAPRGAWTVSDYANLVAEFISKLDLKNVIIVGHSFGGRVGIKLASSRADLVKKLVLVDAAGFATSSAKKSTIGFAAKIVKPIFKPKFMQSLRKKIYKQIGAEDYVATPELQKIFVKVVNEDLSENMKRILQPTLIVFGENDTDTPASTGEKMHSLIPNSKFIILPNAGHFSFTDQPEEFIKNLNKFIYEQ
jgi:pimeloyl-ACP methyl ester carboxylesterase